MPDNVLSLIMQALRNRPDSRESGGLAGLNSLLPPGSRPPRPPELMVYGSPIPLVPYTPRLPEWTPERGSYNPAGFGNREDRSPKGMGWLGPIPYRAENAKPGSVMTEQASTFDIDGKNTLIPLLVPSLDNREVAHLAYGGAPTDGIINKALTFALQRMKSGMSPFVRPGDSPGSPQPSAEYDLMRKMPKTNRPFLNDDLYGLDSLGNRPGTARKMYEDLVNPNYGSGVNDAPSKWK